MLRSSVYCRRQNHEPENGFVMFSLLQVSLPSISFSRCLTCKTSYPILLIRSILTMSNTTLSGPFLFIVDGFSSFELKATMPEARPVQGQSIWLGQQATYFHEESCASDFAAASAPRLAIFASVLGLKASRGVASRLLFLQLRGRAAFLPCCLILISFLVSASWRKEQSCPYVI